MKNSLFKLTLFQFADKSVLPGAQLIAERTLDVNSPTSLAVEIIWLFVPMTVKYKYIDE